MNDFVYSPQALISKGNRFTGNRYPSKYPHWHPPHPQLPCSSFALFCLPYFFYHWCFMPVWLSHTCRGTLFSRPLHKQLPTSFFPHTLDSQTIWKKKKKQKDLSIQLCTFRSPPPIPSTISPPPFQVDLQQRVGRKVLEVTLTWYATFSYVSVSPL